ncbi:MAG: tetratricopeptide repeat protein [Chloroflexota bacterium]
MPGKRVYISFSPFHSLHIVQPIYNSLLDSGYDAYVNMEATVDEVDLRQIEAREHFIIILAPEVLATALNPESRIYQELKTALKSKRNLVALTPHDMSAGTIADSEDIVLRALTKIPRLRINSGHINQVAAHLASDFFTRSPVGTTVPAPEGDADIVAERQAEARSYTRQATIRLNTEKRFLGAVARIRQGKYEEALQDLDTVIAENKQNENAYLQRGLVLRRMGHTTAALRDYEQATNLSPKMVAAHIGRGELLLETSRYQQAKSAFQAALEAQKRSAPALAGLALAYYASGKPDKARELWAHLIQWDAKYGDAADAAKAFGWPDDFKRRAATLLETMK